MQCRVIFPSTPDPRHSRVSVCGAAFELRLSEHAIFVSEMENAKRKHRAPSILLSALLGTALIPTSSTQPRSAYAAVGGGPGELRGQVLGGGAPIANSTVTLWAASAGAPRQLGQTRTGADGRFALNAAGAPGKDNTLYLIAKGGQPAAKKASGDHPAIALMAVVGGKGPAQNTIKEMTTGASGSNHPQ